MLRSIGKQSGESVETVPKKEKKAAVGGICRKGKTRKGENTQQRIVQLSLDTAAHSSAPRSYAQSMCECTIRKIASTSIEKRGSNSDLTGRKNQLPCEQFINFLGFFAISKVFQSSRVNASDSVDKRSTFQH